MTQLNYQRLQEIGYSGYLLKEAPEKVMQFGEGNFLRAFVDYWFDVANEKAGWNGKCAIVTPIPSSSVVCQMINAQQGLYTLYLRGSDKGKKIDQKRIISCVSRCIDPYSADGFQSLMELAVSDDLEYVVSNTTEAGITFDPSCRLEDRPCSSFPGKLTQILYARYQAQKSGLIILPCELIDNNGAELQRCIDQYITLWKLDEEFRKYVHQECTFCSTLVDRIVPGRIRDSEELAKLETQNSYHDDLMDVGEIFGVWNIEGPEWLEEKLPFHAAGLNCPVVSDVTPYKKRKVRILNGAHTGFVLGAYLAGYDIVRDCMQDDTIRDFMNKMLYQEVIPTLPLDRSDLESFAESVQDRFNNPFVNHKLLSISLNSTSKWKTRNLPSLLDYFERSHTLPACLTMSFAAYVAFFSSDIQQLTDEGLVCRRPNGDSYLCCDDRWILEFYFSHRNDCTADLVHAVMTQSEMWGMDLTSIPNFEAAVTAALQLIRSEGALRAYASCL